MQNFEQIELKTNGIIREGLRRVKALTSSFPKWHLAKNIAKSTWKDHASSSTF